MLCNLSILTLQLLLDLLDLVAIPSISSLPEHASDIHNAAAWLSTRLQRAGLEHVKVHATGAQPIVYGDWLHAQGQPTILIYGHYDVQPVDPIDLWESPPFNPVLQAREFRGRGVDDDKGGLLQPIQAVEALLQTVGSLPVNVKFLLEGQEEIGSPHLSHFLASNRDLLRADHALSADGAQITEQQGGVPIGLRGAVAVEVEVQTLNSDQHSGVVGGSVQNPIHALVELLEGMRHANGSIVVAGFYDGVREITKEDRQDLQAFAFDETADMAGVGAVAPHGEQGYTTLERRWLRPTLEVVGIHGGFTGVGIKTIVPSHAYAKISCRLVPHQKPQAIIDALKRHIEANAPAACKVTFRELGFKAAPYIMPRETVTNIAAAKVLAELFPSKPLYYRNGGTIPALALFEEYLGLQMTSFGFGLPDDRIHAPNERYRDSMYKLGRTAYVLILQEIAKLKTANNDDDHITAKPVNDEL